jgi:hypothetical protein
LTIRQASGCPRQAVPICAVGGARYRPGGRLSRGAERQASSQDWQIGRLDSWLVRTGGSETTLAPRPRPRARSWSRPAPSSLLPRTWQAPRQRSQTTPERSCLRWGCLDARPTRSWAARRCRSARRPRRAGCGRHERRSPLPLHLRAIGEVSLRYDSQLAVPTEGSNSSRGLFAATVSSE